MHLRQPEKWTQRGSSNPQRVKLSTDESTTINWVGCAVVHGVCDFLGRLSDNALLFTTELTSFAKSMVFSTPQGSYFNFFLSKRYKRF